MKLKLVEQLNNSNDYNINEDMSIMEEIFGVSTDELFRLVGISSIESKESLDKLYDYCYNNGLYINDIKWQEYRELFNNSSKQILCHGSRNGIHGPIRLNASGESNDFGNGFYVGETLKQAGIFVSEDIDSSIYLMLFNPKNLSYIKFKVDNNWMLAVAYYRKTLGKYANSIKVQRIIDRVSKVDYVIAPIADNRMFELIDAFTSGELTDKQTLYALSATHLGMQYVLKTEKALDKIEILDRCYLCPVERSIYNRQSDIESNTSLHKAFLSKIKYKNEGKYIDELL